MNTGQHRQVSVPRVEFITTIPVLEGSKIFRALNPTTTVVGHSGLPFMYSKFSSDISRDAEIYLNCSKMDSITLHFRTSIKQPQALSSSKFAPHRIHLQLKCFQKYLCSHMS